MSFVIESCSLCIQVWSIIVIFSTTKECGEVRLAVKFFKKYLLAIDSIAYPWAVGSEADGVDVARQRHGGDLVAHEQFHAQRRVQVHFTIVRPGAEQVTVLEQGTRILQSSTDRPTELFFKVLVNISHNFLITFSRMKTDDESSIKLSVYRSPEPQKGGLKK